MTEVIKRSSKANSSKPEFIGRAWKNVVKKEGSKSAGMEFISIRLDRDVEAVTLTHGQSVQLWPNNKREGRNDADYRLSIREEEAK